MANRSTSPVCKPIPVKPASAAALHRSIRLGRAGPRCWPSAADPSARINFDSADQLRDYVTGVTRVVDFGRAGEVDPRGHR